MNKAGVLLVGASVMVILALFFDKSSEAELAASVGASALVLLWLGLAEIAGRD